MGQSTIITVMLTVNTVKVEKLLYEKAGSLNGKSIGSDAREKI